MNRTLCIDVGGSRIRAAVLDPGASLASLQRAPVVSLRSLGWLNETLPELVSPENPLGVACRVDAPYASIAVALPGPVEGGCFLREDLGIPRELAAAFTRVAGLETRLLNDARAWAAGTLACAALSQEAIALPALVLVLGTGVGCAVAFGPDHIEPLEIGAWPLPLPQLAGASGRGSGAGDVHAILGHAFVEWVGQSKRHWSADRIRDEYTRRVAGLLADLGPELARRHGEIQTLVVGGGNADLLDVEALGFAAHRYASGRSAPGIDPDLIPLLGLL